MNDQAARLRKLAESARGNALATLHEEPLRVWRVSGKGGVGKSAIAQNLALALAGEGRRVRLVDPDVSLFSVQTWRPPRGLGIVYAEDGARASRAEPSGSSDWVVSDGAFELPSVPRTVHLVVLTPEPSAVAAAYGTVKNLAASRPESFVLVVNRARGAARAAELGQHVAFLTDRFLGLQPIAIEYVTEDDRIARSTRDLAPLLLDPSTSPAARDLVRMARKLLSLAVPRR